MVDEVALAAAEFGTQEAAHDAQGDALVAHLRVVVGVRAAGGRGVEHTVVGVQQVERVLVEGERPLHGVGGDASHLIGAARRPQLVPQAEDRLEALRAPALALRRIVELRDALVFPHVQEEAARDQGGADRGLKQRLDPASRRRCLSRPVDELDGQERRVQRRGQRQHDPRSPVRAERAPVQRDRARRQEERQQRAREVQVRDDDDAAPPSGRASLGPARTFDAGLSFPVDRFGLKPEPRLRISRATRARAGPEAARWPASPPRDSGRPDVSSRCRTGGRGRDRRGPRA